MFIKLSALLLFAVCFCASALEPLVWDFAVGKNTPRPDMKFNLRGKSVFQDGALYSPDVARSNPGGFLAEEIYPELIPSGGFRFTAVFSLDDATGLCTEVQALRIEE